MSISINVVFGLAALGAIIYGFFRLQIWAIKTAVKEALREYDQEKQRGSQEY